MIAPQCIGVALCSYNHHGLTEIRAWINYTHGFICDVITHPCSNFIEVRAWISNYITYKAMGYNHHGLTKMRTWIKNTHGFIWDVITYPCSNFIEVRAWISNYITYKAMGYNHHGLTKIRTWIKYTHGFIWDVITHPCSNFIEVRAWMSNYITSILNNHIWYWSHKTMDEITYPCPNLSADTSGLFY